jgi:hypothetical protein
VTAVSRSVARGHVASPARLLAQTLTSRLQELAASPDLEVACGGTFHRVAFDGGRFYADDHDEAAEAVLQAVGGEAPMCLRLVEAVATAGTAQLWAALETRPSAVPFDPVLHTLPASYLRVLLARALQEEFLDASPTVRDAVGQLGLALAGVEAPPIDLLRTRYQLTRELPHWDPGPGPWSDRELVLLSRCMRMGAGEARPHLQLLPSDALARRAVATYVIALLDADRTLTWGELRAALSPTFRNVRALSSLLIAEGLLDETEGGYRVRTPGRARTRRARA